MSDSRKELVGRLKQGVTWIFFASAITGAINVLFQIWFARKLGVGIIGQYATLFIVVELANALLSFGFNQIVIRDSREKIYRGALALILIQSAAALVLSYVLYASALLVPSLSAKPDYLALGIMAVMRVIGVYSSLLYAPLERDLRYRGITLARLFAMVGGVLAGLGSMVAMGPSLYVLILRDAVATILMVVLIWPQVKPLLVPDFSKEATGPVFRFSLPLLGLNLMERGAARLDQALVGLYMGGNSLGMYFQTKALVDGLLGFVITPIQTAVYAFYCKFQERASLYRGILRWVGIALVFLTIGSAGALALCGAPLIGAILGPEWRPAGKALAGLAVYAAGVFWFENVKVMAMAEGAHAKMIWARSSQLLCLLVAVIPLAKLWGFAGAGAATGLAGAVLALSATALFFRKFQKSEPLAVQPGLTPGGGGTELRS
jgi:O-antigen/teichoic acid export membrane protein